jgi:hypothetical protein
LAFFLFCETVRYHYALVRAEVTWQSNLKRLELKESIREFPKLFLIPDLAGVPEKFEKDDKPRLPSGLSCVEEIECWHRSIPTNRILNCESSSTVRDDWMHALVES